jgi:hypothetical protein
MHSEFGKNLPNQAGFAGKTRRDAVGMPSTFCAGQMRKENSSPGY